jgi:hypothetical protein
MKCKGFARKRSGLYYPCVYLEGLGKTTKTAVMMAGIQVEIRTVHFKNTSLGRYCYNKPIQSYGRNGCYRTDMIKCLYSWLLLNK